MSLEDIKINNHSPLTQQKKFLFGLSVLLSLGLWLYILSSQPVVIEKKYSLKVVPPKGTGVSNFLPIYLTVELKGARAFLRKFMRNDQTLVIDLNSEDYLGKKSFNWKVDRSDIYTPLGVEVVSVKPFEFEIEWDKLIYKKVPLKLELNGHPPEDQKLVKADLEPQSITIEGPRSIMKKIGKIDVGPIDKGVLQGAGEMDIELVTPDSRIFWHDPAELPVKLIFESRPTKANFLVKGVPIRFLSSSRRFSSVTKRVDLTVLIAEQSRDNFDRGQIQVVADIPEGANGNHRVKLNVKLPPDMHLLQIYPQYINVKVK